MITRFVYTLFVCKFYNTPSSITTHATFFAISIKIFPPAKAKTRKGIQLIQSTLNDVISAHGKPEFTTSKDSDLWNADYRGIQFCFQREISLPKFPFIEQLHRNKKIIKISVIK